MNLDMPDTGLQEGLALYRRFAENWSVPVTADTLKMFLACALDTSMQQEGVLAIGDELWERYYQRFLCLL